MQTERIDMRVSITVRTSSPKALKTLRIMKMMQSTKSILTALLVSSLFIF